jgi:hypothetical protein
MEDIKLTSQIKTTLADDDWLVGQAESAGRGQMFRIKAGDAIPVLPDTIITSGAGSPEGAVTAPVGSLFTRTDGDGSTAFYVKKTGTGNTGWVALVPDTIITRGAGSPEGAVTAPVGSLFTRTDGGASTTLYVKESGTGNTGWVAK